MLSRALSFSLVLSRALSRSLVFSRVLSCSVISHSYALDAGASGVAEGEGPLATRKRGVRRRSSRDGSWGDPPVGAVAVLGDEG